MFSILLFLDSLVEKESFFGYIIIRLCHKNLKIVEMQGKQLCFQ